MPPKYHIHTHPAPPRKIPVGRFGVVDLGEDCVRVCLNCVKRRCVYDVYRKDREFRKTLNNPADFKYECMNCLRCVEGCTRNVLVRVENPEYKWLGDSYYTPEIIVSAWYQAETGKIPVSGAGYRGRFSGPGFDSMWTDMSEIVRPTRDGIHGREYISTMVEVGRKLSRLDFGPDRELESVSPPNIEIPLPVIIDTPEFGVRAPGVTASLLQAAAQLGTFAVLAPEHMPGPDSRLRRFAIPRLGAEQVMSEPHLFQGCRMVQVDYKPGVLDCLEQVKADHGSRIMIVRLPLGPEAEDQVADLARNGAEAVQLQADMHGMSDTARGPLHHKDVLRRIHARLVKEGLRDQVTLIAAGGVAAAEHMAKAVICGADLVVMDFPAQIAIECRLCGECKQGFECPAALEETKPELGTLRIVNLAAAWHNQLLEVMGAMGIREVRRLRAETGRAMFFEDLERDTFGRLFGQRVESQP